MSFNARIPFKSVRKITGGVVFLVAISTAGLKAQGCSDAGFCTIGAMKHEPTDSTVTYSSTSRKKHRITFIAPTGVGDENVFVFSPGLQYDFAVSKPLSLQLKVVGNYASGELGNKFAAGDIYVSAAYKFELINKWHLLATAAAKMPLSKSDLQANKRTLPMQYQSSLGTYDAVLGITATNNNWSFSTAIQQPLSGKNNNGYLPMQGDPKMNYSPTNLFKRKGDILLRAGKNFALGRKWLFNAGLLSIYHLGKDEYTDYRLSNSPIQIEGSEGVTVNVTAAAWWQLSQKLRLGVTGGIPIVVRDVRPDGLTRKFVFAPELSWSF